MINNKNFDHRPIKELLAIVKQDLPDLDAKGLIDDGVLVKTIMYCNEKLGLPIREVKEICLEVKDYKAFLPLNFEKLYYAAALTVSNSITHNLTNPFDNNFDRDKAIYDACLDRESLGCVDNYKVIVKRTSAPVSYYYTNFVSLHVGAGQQFCHASCPNVRKDGKYTITIDSEHIHTPFRTGEIYMMYVGTMQDEEGNLLFPFHPLITPYYEWAIKEKILTDALFNSDGDYVRMLEYTKNERAKAWMDAFNVTTDRAYGDYVKEARKRELGWYNQYFKFFQ